MRAALLALAGLLFGAAIGISWTWGAPGTVNGATVLALGFGGIALAALWYGLNDADIVRRLWRGVRGSKRSVTIHYVNREPNPSDRNLLMPTQRGDQWFVLDERHVVRSIWRFDGKHWTLQDRYPA